MSRKLRIDGEVVECVSISELAKVLNRHPHTIRAWEKSGLIPRGFIIHASNERARRRYYPLRFVEAARQIAEHQRFGSRRPSNLDAEQARAFFRAWDHATESPTAQDHTFGNATALRASPEAGLHRQAAIRPARQVLWATAETVPDRRTP